MIKWAMLMIVLVVNMTLMSFEELEIQMDRIVFLNQVLINLPDWFLLDEKSIGVALLK